jgi:uncharacterized OB-fold protein
MSVPSSVPKAVPQPTPTTAPYWEGTKAGELRLQHCADCRKYIFYPRIRCPHCGSANIPWEATSGRGKLHSYVINHVAAPGWQGETPYVIAIVELDEGPRMMSNLVGVAPDPEQLVLDMPLEVVFVPRGDQVLPLFQPATGAAR